MNLDDSSNHKDDDGLEQPTTEATKDYAPTLDQALDEIDAGATTPVINVKTPDDDVNSEFPQPPQDDPKWVQRASITLKIIRKESRNGGDDIRRLTVPSDFDYAHLSALIGRLFDQSFDGRITYIDDEGDEIAITNDGELKEALRIASDRKYLRLTLNPRKNKKVASVQKQGAHSIAQSIGAAAQAWAQAAAAQAGATGNHPIRLRQPPQGFCMWQQCHSGRAQQLGRFRQPLVENPCAPLCKKTRSCVRRANCAENACRVLKAGCCVGKFILRCVLLFFIPYYAIQCVQMVARSFGVSCCLAPILFATVACGVCCGMKSRRSKKSKCAPRRCHAPTTTTTTTTTPPPQIQTAQVATCNNNAAEVINPTPVAAVAPQQQQQQQVPPIRAPYKYQTQLDELISMGFSKTHSNLHKSILEYKKGDLQAVVGLLVGEY